jgi:DNA-binding GntR family transcriptional regulator
MQSALADFSRAVRAGDMRAQVASTSAFYGHILRLCGNRIIEETLSGLLARINFLRARSMSQPGRAKVSLQEMKAICDAIAAGNGNAARAAAARHVENASASANAAYESLTPSDSAA